MMVIFLTGLVSMILMRTLRNDYAKYAREDDDIESLVNYFIALFQYAFSNNITLCILVVDFSFLFFWEYGRREMLMRNLDGSWFMEMSSGHLVIWLFFQLLWVLVRSLPLLFC
jgi:hypothetical protein